ncbi:hypothetical protein NYO67_4606 [Aspergillus flavus]|nr:hypothetical protein NYO67_4606 [Aspergillus flavus]
MSMAFRLPRPPFAHLHKPPLHQAAGLATLTPTVTRKDIPPIAPAPCMARAANPLLQRLLEGYRPVFQAHPLGREVSASLTLSPQQQMCYYERKLFGGYLTFLLDWILADCCPSAVTAYLNTTFLHAVPPDASIHLRAWPEKVDGRKVYLAGTIQILKGSQGDVIDAVRAHALFVRPKPAQPEN